MENISNVKPAVMIDLNVCVGCGLCAKDCVGGAIDIHNSKAVPNSQSCILCGHCEAICPKDAISITGFADEVESFEEQTRLDPDQLLEAIKTRRTVRQFTKQEVPQDVLDMILEAGRLAPTGGNSQGTRYVLLQDKKDACESIAVQMFGKIINIGKKLIPFLSKMNIDNQFFFKGAPVVIVVLGRDKVSASLAAENMAFMSEANGLGVLFSGFFTMCVNRSSKIRKLMGIPKKPKAVTTLVLGYPAVRYHKTTHRKPLDLTKA